VIVVTSVNINTCSSILDILSSTGESISDDEVEQVVVILSAWNKCRE
jgi:hypothetical protein